MNFQLMDIVTTLSECNACFVFNTQNLYRVNDHILQSPSNHLIFKTYILLSLYNIRLTCGLMNRRNIKFLKEESALVLSVLHL